jgi:aspartyl-tRNA(Asn)/glutamyl-tRNA(Gln) amidotransferase subunit A
MDQVGPITKDVRDAALLLQSLSGYDTADSTSVNRPVPDYLGSLTGEIRNLRIGVPKEYFVAGLQPETEAAVRGALRQLEQSGASVEEVSLPHSDYAIAVYYIVATAEASSNLARYDGMRFGRRVEGADLLETYLASRAEGFGTEVKRRIMLGTYALSAGYYDAYYLKAQQVRRLIKQDFDQVFERVDAVVTPTAPTTAFKIGEKIDDPLAMYLSDTYTISANLAGLPALSVRCGFDGAGLPIGMQIVGKPFDEPTILNLAYSYEQSTPWGEYKPDL